MDNKFTVFILRGPSGSGKSTLAKQFMDSGLCKYWVETDKFFYENGVYKFNPAKLGINHTLALEQFRQCVLANDGNIVQSNTNIKKDWYLKYAEFAKEHGFQVTEIIMGQQFQNTHGVPADKVKQMQANFEL